MLSFDDGGSIMVDKGFKMEDLLKKPKAKLTSFPSKGPLTEWTEGDGKNCFTTYPYGATYPEDQELPELWRAHFYLSHSSWEQDEDSLCNSQQLQDCKLQRWAYLTL